MLTQDRLTEAYLAACELELRAYKPGNVSTYACGHGMTVADFRLSAEVSAPFVVDQRLDLGAKILGAIDATRRAVGCNTNLGIVLLAVPLIAACETWLPGEELRTALRRVLQNTTQRDAAQVYQAIRLAAPGGLRRTDEQDVHDVPTVTLLNAMRLAAGRDRVAYQYAHAYPDVFDFAIPRYHTARLRWGDDAWAAASVYVGILKRIPDSHLERKHGTRYTRMVAAKMAALGDALDRSEKPECVLGQFQAADDEFKALGINPGTTADLTVTCLLAARLEELLIRC